MKQHLLLGGEKMLKEALMQTTLELKVVKLTVESSIRLRKTSDRALWTSRPPPKL
jgi:hypothetical protein